MKSCLLKTITRYLPWYEIQTWWKKEEMKWERDWCENEARMMWDKERKESEKVRAWWIDGVFVKTVRWDVSVWKSENVWDWERSQCDGVNVKSDWWDEMVSLSESCENESVNGEASRLRKRGTDHEGLIPASAVRLRAWMMWRRACEKTVPDHDGLIPSSAKETPSTTDDPPHHWWSHAQPPHPYKTTAHRPLKHAAPLNKYLNIPI